MPVLICQTKQIRLTRKIRVLLVLQITGNADLADFADKRGWDGTLMGLIFMI